LERGVAFLKFFLTVCVYKSIVYSGKKFENHRGERGNAIDIYRYFYFSAVASVAEFNKMEKLSKS